jgi:hypothetical protein
MNIQLKQISELQDVQRALILPLWNKTGTYRPFTATSCPAGLLRRSVGLLRRSVSLLRRSVLIIKHLNE